MCKGMAVVFADPSANPRSGYLLPPRNWQAARRGFWDVLSGSPDGSQGQGRSCHAPEISVWEGRGAVLQMAPSTGWHLPGWQSPRSFAGMLLFSSVFPKRLPKSVSTSCRLCFGSVTARAPQPAGSYRTRRRAVPGTPGAPAPRPGCAAFSACRGWQGLQIPACCCLPSPPPPAPPPPPPPPHLAGRRQGCCMRHWSRRPRGMCRGGRGHGSGSLAAGEALGEVAELPMLRRPDWKRTRQACGSSGPLIPLCPGKRGCPGREGPFSGLRGPHLWGS